MNYQPHPLAAFNPPLAPDRLAALEADILAHGLLHAPVSYDGLILDGNHRIAICQKHGIPFDVQPLPADMDPYVYTTSCLTYRVLSDEQRHQLNDQRTTWNREQLKAVQEQASAEGHAEMKHGGRPKASKKGSAIGTTFKPTKKQQDNRKRASAKVAAAMGVSQRGGARWARIEKNGCEALKEAVAEHTISLSQGNEIARLDPKDQQKVLAAGTPKQRHERLAAAKQCQVAQRTFNRPEVEEPTVGPFARLLLEDVELLGTALSRAGARDADAIVVHFFAEFDANSEPYHALMDRYSYVVTALTTIFDRCEQALAHT